MRYFKVIDQRARYQTEDWGTFCIYVEFADDDFPCRMVQEYEEGNSLRYDRTRWVDQYGMLATTKINEEHLEPTDTTWPITVEEFEIAWQRAAKAPNQPQVYDSRGFPTDMELTEKQFTRLPPWIAAHVSGQ